jgi:hypothetical protein
LFFLCTGDSVFGFDPAFMAVGGVGGSSEAARLYRPLSREKVNITSQAGKSDRQGLIKRRNHQLQIKEIIFRRSKFCFILVKATAVVAIDNNLALPGIFLYGVYAYPATRDVPPWWRRGAGMVRGGAIPKCWQSASKRSRPSECLGLLAIDYAGCDDYVNFSFAFGQSA